MRRHHLYRHEKLRESDSQFGLIARNMPEIAHAHNFAWAISGVTQQYCAAWSHPDPMQVITRNFLLLNSILTVGLAQSYATVTWPTATCTCMMVYCTCTCLVIICSGGCSDNVNCTFCIHVHVCAWPVHTCTCIYMYGTIWYFIYIIIHLHVPDIAYMYLLMLLATHWPLISYHLQVALVRNLWRKGEKSCRCGPIELPDTLSSLAAMSFSTLWLVVIVTNQ